MVADNELKDVFEKASFEYGDKVVAVLMQLDNIQQLFTFLVRQLTLSDFTAKQCVKYYCLMMLSLVCSTLYGFRDQQYSELYYKIVSCPDFKKYFEAVILKMKQYKLSSFDCQDLIQQLIQIDPLIQQLNQQKLALELEGMNNKIFQIIQQQILDSQQLTEQLLYSEQSCQKCHYLTSFAHVCNEQIENDNTHKYGRVSFNNFEDYLKTIRENKQQFIE